MYGQLPLKYYKISVLYAAERVPDGQGFGTNGGGGIVGSGSVPGRQGFGSNGGGGIVGGGRPPVGPGFGSNGGGGIVGGGIRPPTGISCYTQSAGSFQETRIQCRASSGCSKRVLCKLIQTLLLIQIN